VQPQSEQPMKVFASSPPRTCHYGKRQLDRGPRRGRP